MKLNIDQIKRDGGTQPRVALDYDTIFDYTDLMRDGVKFPPVIVFYDGTYYWLADGFHRIEAAEATGFDTIDCEVIQGTREDAQWYSYGANKTNGLRRTNEDKQRAVKAALMHPKGAGLSDRAIAEHVGVDKQTVSNWREKLGAGGEIRHVTERKGLDGKTYSVASNGRRERQAAQTKAAAATSPVSRAPESLTPTPPKPAPTAARESGSTPTPMRQSAPSEDRLAFEWVGRVYRACIEIADCEVTTKDLAAHIRGSARRGPITKGLKDAYEFLAEVIAETDPV